MSDLFESRLAVIQNKLDQLVSGRLIIERDMNAGEQVVDYLNERRAEMIEIKDSFFWLAIEFTHLLSDIREFTDKFNDAKSDPRINELWQIIETAMSITK